MNRMKELRVEKGLTMMDVAKSLNLPYTTYVNYEKGAREPDSEKLIAIANYFDVSIDYLLCRTNERIPAGDAALFQHYMQTIEQPTAPEWYDGLTEEQKQAVKLIAHLPEEQLNILLRVAEQMQLPRSQETE